MALAGRGGSFHRVPKIATARVIPISIYSAIMNSYSISSFEAYPATAFPAGVLSLNLQAPGIAIVNGVAPYVRNQVVDDWAIQVGTASFR